MSLRSTTRPLYFWNCGCNSEFLRWQRSINTLTTQIELFFLHSLLQRSPLFLVLTFVSCHAGIFSSSSNSFSAAAFASGIFIAWRIKFVHKIVVVQLLNSSSCNMIFMTFMKSSFHTLSRRFVGFNDTCVFCLTIFRDAAGFPVLFASVFARHCSWHRNFQLSTRIFHDILEFFVSWINEVNTTQSSGIVELWFLDGPLLLLFSFRRFRQIFPSLWPQGVWSGGRLVFCQSVPDHVYPSGGFSFNILNLVKTVHVSDNSRRSWTFQ